MLSVIDVNLKIIQTRLGPIPQARLGPTRSEPRGQTLDNYDDSRKLT